VHRPQRLIDSARTTSGLLQSPPPPRRPMQGPAPAHPLLHHMMTRTQTGVVPPVNYKGLSATSTSPLPANYRSVLADPNWRVAMADEYEALLDNNTWRLIPRPPSANIVKGKWLFKHKYHVNGSLCMPQSSLCCPWLLPTAWCRL
jgi:histone deacetylase 1/2